MDCSDRLSVAFIWFSSRWLYRLQINFILTLSIFAQSIYFSSLWYWSSSLSSSLYPCSHHHCCWLQNPPGHSIYSWPLSPQSPLNQGELHTSSGARDTAHSPRWPTLSSSAVSSLSSFWFSQEAFVSPLHVHPSSVKLIVHSSHSGHKVAHAHWMETPQACGPVPAPAHLMCGTTSSTKQGLINICWVSVVGWVCQWKSKFMPVLGGDKVGTAACAQIVQCVSQPPLYFDVIAQSLSCSFVTKF